jgi:hypothetical protein
MGLPPGGGNWSPFSSGFIRVNSGYSYSSIIIPDLVIQKQVLTGQSCGSYPCFYRENVHVGPLEIRVGCDLHDVLKGGYGSSGAVNRYPEGDHFVAIFTPGCDKTIDESAALGSFVGFNWYQRVIAIENYDTLNAKWVARFDVARDLFGQQLPFVDPALGGNPDQRAECAPEFGDDFVPWYWSEVVTCQPDSYIGNHVSTTSLDFVDYPKFGDIFFDGTIFALSSKWRYVFETKMVGVQDSFGRGQVLSDIFPDLANLQFRWSYEQDQKCVSSGDCGSTSNPKNAVSSKSGGGIASDLGSFTTSFQTLDVDRSSIVTEHDALTDGLLILRYLFGLSGPSLTAGALGSTATRLDSTVIKTYLDNIRSTLDVDGDGNADALTDGLILIRYMFGLRGSALVRDAVSPNATRTQTAIETYLESLMP